MQQLWSDSLIESFCEKLFKSSFYASIQFIITTDGSFTIKNSYMANSNKLSGCHKMKQLLTQVFSEVTNSKTLLVLSSFRYYFLLFKKLFLTSLTDKM